MPSSSASEFSVPLFHHIGLLFVSLAAVSEAVCQFPDPWLGKWFQSGIQQHIVIESDSMNFRGRCIEAEGDKYLIHDRQEGCYRCMVIHERHMNVLQYKETYCEPHTESICNRINGDAQLYTMFRENAVPETCPFSGPFSFFYNRGTGECSNPPSSVDSCTEDYRLLLRFQACPDVSGTESTTEELICLANWKEGSTRFLVGKLEHKMATALEDKYRCFIYEETEDETGFQVAQSGDATCAGLFTPNEGSRTMKLARTNPLYASCEFPDWMTSYPPWHTLDRRKIYIFDMSTNTTFNVTDAESATPEMQVTCYEMKSIHDRRAVMILHATKGCRNGYMCAVFHRRKEHVIEFQKGSLTHLPEDACTKILFDEDSAEFVTLLTKSPGPKQCPHLGKYNVLGMQRHHQALLPPPRENCKTFTEIHVGCNRFDLIEFHPDCPLQQEAITYQCHGSWHENGTYYLITSLKGSTARFCFIYVESENVVKFSGVQETCNRRIQPGVTGFLTFNISNEGECSDINDAVSGPSASQFLTYLLALISWSSTLWEASHNLVGTS